MSQPVFDLCGPLPERTVVLEASAGTGKTHAIAALAARYLAEGVARIDELMLVTFGRAATVELRERVRERLTSTTAALADPEAARRSGDEVTAYLATGSDADVAVRRGRLARAVAAFDAATIATTHGFCHQMLAGLGIAADVDADVAFTETTGDIVAEAVNDFYVRAYAQAADPPVRIPFATASRVAVNAVGDPSARLEPVGAAPGSEADVRRRLAESVRQEVGRRKSIRRVMDYDDLLDQLRRALTDQQTGEAARARVRSRYKIVLVDEFQDTDPVQWQILESAFHGHRTLVLIGDPKQAIYAFRGADVVTYLLATKVADSESTLGTNWRSDARLLDALGEVFGGAALGNRDILVHKVSAAHPRASLVGGHVDAPLRIRQLRRSEVGVADDATVYIGPAREHIARDVAADIVALLSSGAAIRARDAAAESTTADRPLEPGDVAVLVQRNDDGRTVRDALRDAGVPVVLTGTSSVFLSAAADDWLTLLTALEQPNRTGLARSAALTSFVGWTAEGLAGDEAAFDDFSVRLRELGEVLSRRGVAALFEAVTASFGLTSRVLSRPGGERELTDLRHIAQALHEAGADGQFGVVSLVQWLRRRIAEAGEDSSEELSRRLESDARAVQIITVHRSKGLEFPVVYAPYLWDRYVHATPDPVRMHDDEGRRVLDVGGKDGAGYPERSAAHAREDAGESLRLAYVALTRARAQVVVWWAPTLNTGGGPLHRLLFAARSGDGEIADRAPVPSDTWVREGLDQLAARAGGAISIEDAEAGAARRWKPTPAPTPQLSVREFARSLDLAWTRTSYSGITAGLHELSTAGHVVSEAEDPGTVDEPQIETVGDISVGSAADSADSMPSPMAGLPVGAAFGTVVHRVLELADFAAADLDAELHDACESADAERSTGIATPVLAAALVPAVSTPLGRLAGGLRLRDIGRSDRLDELDFELPLAGGDAATGEAFVGQIAALLRDRLEADDILAGYAADLDAPTVSTRSMRGFLAGSIDAVLRVRDPSGGPRFIVVDYKTNWLGADAALTAANYRPDAMAQAMRSAHYPLQAMLYSVALHRFLRWRVPGYDPSTHLGGVLYLFLRGMCGPATPTADDPDQAPYGVFSWSPPTSLVTDLSDLLDRGQA
jgi:exodeoxyribonuclease V beta subunit